MSDTLKGWIGVDLDGTLAHYDHWRGPEHIGEPIPAMLERVKTWLAEGHNVKILTARVGGGTDAEKRKCEIAIWNWCMKHVGMILDVTCSKDFDMIELWDDRAVQVVPNTGLSVRETIISLRDEDLIGDDSKICSWCLDHIIMRIPQSQR